MLTRVFEVLPAVCGGRRRSTPEYLLAIVVRTGLVIQNPGHYRVGLLSNVKGPCSRLTRAQAARRHGDGEAEGDGEDEGEG